MTNHPKSAESHDSAARKDAMTKPSYEELRITKLTRPLNTLDSASNWRRNRAASEIRENLVKQIIF